MRRGREIPLLVALALTACLGRGTRGVPDRLERASSEELTSGKPVPAATTTVSSVSTAVPVGTKPQIFARAYSAALATTKTHVYFGDADDDWLVSMPKAGASEPTRVARHAPVAGALVVDETAVTWIASPGDSVLRLPLGSNASPTTIRDREIFSDLAAEGGDVFLVSAAPGGGALTRITGATAARLASFDLVPRSVMVDATSAFVVTTKNVVRTPRKRGDVTTLATGTSFGASASDDACVYVTTKQGSSRAILRVPKYGGAMTALSAVDGVRDAPIAVRNGEVYYFDESAPILRAHAIDSGATRVVSDDPIFDRVNALVIDDDGAWVATGEASSGAIARVALH